MPTVTAHGIRLCYETTGDPAAPPLLLIHGLAAQLVDWEDDFCQLVADHGFRVIRFDNRDVGLSTKIDGPAPDLAGLFLRGDRSTISYLLADMADDAAGLLDALDVSQAHIVGVSMGGMIAQSLAIAHPDRCLTLTSIMSMTGAPGVGMPKESVLPVLLTPAPSDRESIIEHELRNARAIASPGFPFDEAWQRSRVERDYERCWCPDGVLRQLAAVTASPDRTPELRSLAVPTLVIHGAEDPLVQVDGGRATADAVPGARLVVIEGMGHDLPRSLWPEIVDTIAGHARQEAGAVSGTQP